MERSLAGLDHLKVLLEKLMDKYVSAKEENLELSEQCKKLNASLAAEKKKAADVESALKASRIAAAAAPGEEGREQARQDINALIRKIDKCIALLNN